METRDLESLAERLELERELLGLQERQRVSKRSFTVEFNGVQVSYPTYLRLTRLQVRKDWIGRGILYLVVVHCGLVVLHGRSLRKQPSSLFAPQ